MVHKHIHVFVHIQIHILYSYAYTYTGRFFFRELCFSRGGRAHEHRGGRFIRCVCVNMIICNHKQCMEVLRFHKSVLLLLLAVCYVDLWMRILTQIFKGSLNLSSDSCIHPRGMWVHS